MINKQDSNIPTLWDNDTPVTSSSGKADLLNRYFHDCFNHSFPPLKNPTPLDPTGCPASILCTEEEISELLHNLNPAKSTGMDGVSAIMLKSTAPSIAASLTKLFNISIATGCFTKDWKCARITPIFKSSDPSSPKTIGRFPSYPLSANFWNAIFIPLCSDTYLKAIQFHHSSGALCPEDQPLQLYTH